MAALLFTVFSQPAAPPPPPMPLPAAGAGAEEEEEVRLGAKQRNHVFHKSFILAIS